MRYWVKILLRHRSRAVLWAKRAWSVEGRRLDDRWTVLEVNPRYQDRISDRIAYDTLAFPCYYEKKKHRYSLFDNRDSDLDNSRSQMTMFADAALFAALTPRLVSRCTEIPRQNISELKLDYEYFSWKISLVWI